MIDVLVIRLRVDYFLYGDQQIRDIYAPPAFTHSAGYARRSGTFDVLFNYCINSRVEYNKDIGAMLLLLCGGRILRGGLSMTEVYTKCTALFIMCRRTLVRCK